MRCVSHHRPAERVRFVLAGGAAVSAGGGLANRRAAPRINAVGQAAGRWVASPIAVRLLA